MSRALADCDCVILIGPAGAGKTTLGRLVGATLGLRSVSLDDVAREYYEEHGCSKRDFERIRFTDGYLAAYRWLWPSFAYAVERVLDDYTGSVFDFGAAHSHYEDERLLGRVASLLAPYRNVFLVLPSPDLDRSVALLRARSVALRNRDWIIDGYDFLDHWVKDESNHRVAKHVVYTDGISPDEASRRIVRLIDQSPTGGAE